MSRDKEIERLIALLSYRTPRHPFIQVDDDACRKCTERVCLRICPAGVYKEDEERRIVVRWERCLECGACRLSCRFIRWSYPPGGKGVVYKFG